MASHSHVDLTQVKEHVRYGKYPACMSSGSSAKGLKKNFRRGCKSFSWVDGQFLYKDKRTVIISRTEQQEIIHDVHKGMASHQGRESTYEKISGRFYWHNMISDVREFIAKCDECQRLKRCQNRFPNVCKTYLFHHKAQIGVDICNSALSVAEFLYEMSICERCQRKPTYNERD